MIAVVDECRQNVPLLLRGSDEGFQPAICVTRADAGEKGIAPAAALLVAVLLDEVLGVVEPRLVGKMIADMRGNFGQRLRRSTLFSVRSEILRSSLFQASRPRTDTSAMCSIACCVCLLKRGPLFT